MSRAFVRETEPDALEPLPERPVSRHPNFVTAAGLRQIDARLRGFEAAREAAAGEPGTLARIERDARYWRQRHASARLIEPPAAPTVVRFGVTVRLRFPDGVERSFQIVGEDEADPAAGQVSWVSPVATALIGRVPGEAVEIFGRRATVIELRA
ncbi:MAG TPA: GreA/GreB family elongation factor [Steroidobacteraceae bacterium]|jgi:transcription elongation GreA/GreB family factor|nr:GreA/GreB family elongation factor [Steroidobacteraceae bacterium]